MSRYVKEIETTKNAVEVEANVTQYLKNEKFKLVDHRGEKVWKKGLGLMLGPQFVKVEVDSGKVHLEAWIKFALLPGLYLGEMGIEGAMALIPKRKLRARVEQIEKLIR